MASLVAAEEKGDDLSAVDAAWFQMRDVALFTNHYPFLLHQNFLSDQLRAWESAGQVNGIPPSGLRLRFRTGPALNLSQQVDPDKESLRIEWSGENGGRFDTFYSHLLPGLSNGRDSSSLLSNASWGASFEVPLFGEFARMNAEVGYGAFDAESGFGFGHPDHRLFKMGLVRQSGSVGYGYSYQSAGKLYRTVGNKRDRPSTNVAGGKGIEADKAGHESWVSWAVSDFTFKTSFSEFWNNVNDDPRSAQTTDRLIKFSTDYMIYAWPYVGLSVAYGAGERESQSGNQRQTFYKGPLDLISAGLTYSGDYLNFSAGSVFSKSSNELSAHDGSKIITHYLSAGYSLTPSIYITPAISFNEEYYSSPGTELKYTSTSSSISLSYTPLDRPYHVTAFASYDTYKGNDQFTDNASIYGLLRLDWDVKRNAAGKHMLSFELSNSSYADHIFSQYSSNDLYFGVMWRWARF